LNHSYTAEKIAAPLSPSYWDLSEEPIESQVELFKKYDSFTLSDYEVLVKLCQKLKIEFLTSCFDEDWVEKLDPFLLRFKVASADITNYQLLTSISKKNKPILLSTGAATLDEVANAIEVIRKYSKCKISLLHCVLNYPTQHQNANLSRITEIARNFPGYEIGYSDHTKPIDSHMAILIARTLGATIFEKHFTLNKKLKGNDHYHAFDEFDVADILLKIKALDDMMPFSEDKFLDIQDKARRFARRGLYARRDLKPGEIISSDMIISLRPIPDGGIPAEDISALIGKTLSREFNSGELIKIIDISQPSS
jgi:N-acetylneuraminate synthase